MFVLLLGLLLAAGPKPEKKDIPYIVHANTLVQTEAVEAARDGADESRYSIPGETSPARTPLALPIFLLDTSDIKPEKVRLIRLKPSGGHREAVLGRRPAPDDDPPLLLTVTDMGGGLYKFEAVNEVENGEYALNVAGTDRFFCFTVF